MTSKLGVHSLRPTADARRMVEAGSPIVELVDDFGPAGEFLAINPRLVLIGRTTSPRITGEELRASGLSPADAATRWMNAYREAYRLNPLITLWTGPNEPVWNDVAGMIWYGLFETARVQLLMQIGLHAVVGNFSTGTPDITGPDLLQWWNAFLPALRAAQQFNGYLGLHEYSDGKLSKDVDEAGEGWNTFRYRRVHRLALAPNGLADLKIVLTEFGVDFKIRDIDYAAELAWADGEMRKDPYLVGATIFTFGSTDPAWDNFNIADTPVMTPLLAHVQAMANEPEPAPTMTPAPLPIPSLPPQSSENNMPILVYKNDWFDGQQAIDVAHDNMRVPLAGKRPFLLDYLHDTAEPQLPGADPTTVYLPLESTMRSGDTALYPFTERLPNSELALYLTPASPIVWHGFRLHGKGWWTLWDVLDLTPGKYRFVVESYPDIYTGNHVWAPDPLSGEWRLRFAGQPESEWLNGATTLPQGEGDRKFFGHWATLYRDVDHLGGLFQHGFEFRSRWGIEHVGMFLRGWKIYRLEDAPMPIPEPVSSPSGDVLVKLKSARDQAQSLAALLDDLYVNAAVEFVDRRLCRERCLTNPSNPAHFPAATPWQSQAIAVLGTLDPHGGDLITG